MGKTLPKIQIGKVPKRVQINAHFKPTNGSPSGISSSVNEYLLALTNNRPIRGRTMLPYYSSVFLSLVPMVNPDGVDLVIHGAPSDETHRRNVLAINRGSTNFSGWKANIRGVDLNNQYPAMWEREAARRPKEPSPRDFPGYRPLTEPEAIAMAQMTESENFNRVLAYHTQGRVIYWVSKGWNRGSKSWLTSLTGKRFVAVHISKLGRL
jgi:g-D-glutamyl-meso-diaminopimelate peptidase